MSTTKPSTGLKFKLYEYEENRYHDSYGHLCYYDQDADEIKYTSHWSTAFAGGEDMSQYLLPTAEVANRYFELAAESRYKGMRKHMLYCHLHHPDFVNGMAVLVKHSAKGKAQVKRGDSGVVFWVGEDQYARGCKRVGVQLEDERKVFINGQNLMCAGKLEPRGKTKQKAKFDAENFYGVRQEKSWLKDFLNKAKEAA